MENGLILPCRRAPNADASGNVAPGIRPVEPRTVVDAVTAGSDSSAEQGNATVPGAREKASASTVPRSDAGAHGGESLGLSGATDVREFGKLVPYVRKKGCLPHGGRSQ